MKEGEPFIFLPQFVYFNFVALPFTWSASFCLMISLSISISKLFFDMTEYFIMTEYYIFSANFSKEIAKLFSESDRTSANNSSSFSVHRLAIFVVLTFLSAIITCSNLSNHIF